MEYPFQDYTPITKISQNMERGIPKYNLAILVSTGAYNPIHRGHIQIMSMAKTECEWAGYSVIGGFISPSHRNYLVFKGGHDYYSDTDRIEMARLATLDSDWIDVSTWEINK